jgi:DNA sulfur modification protein DndD
VVRFFLFDAELLQEYETLLRDQSDMGRGIQKAIEQILGVPDLTDSRASLRRVLGEIQERYSKAAGKNAKSQQIANTLRQSLERRGLLQKQRLEQGEELRRLTQERKKARDALRRYEKARNIIDEKSRLAQEKSNLSEELDRKREQARSLFEKAWLWAVMPPLEAAADAARHEVDAERKRDSRERIGAELRRLAAMSLQKDTCTLCGQPLAESARTHLEARSGEGGPESAGASASPTTSAARLADLSGLIEPNHLPGLLSVLGEVEQIRIRISQKTDLLAEVDQQAAGMDESALRQDMASLELAATQIGLQEDGIAKIEKAMQENEAAITRLEKEVDKLNVPEMDGIRRQKDLAANLVSLFDKAVEEYREDLRRKIEQDATQFFLELTTEHDYGALRINENYGLTIVHRDGRAIPIRSAGAEHVVALSLIAALQNNAPVHGPVVMDSPFGRLDEQHKRRVVRCLPQLASQVTLLVYRSEVDPQVVRQELKGKLGREYAINRISARHSAIESESGGAHG